MRKLFLLIFLLSLFGEIYSQCKLLNGEYIAFKENSLWGIKETKTEYVIVSPRYVDLFVLNDSILLVLNESKKISFGPTYCLVINYKGDTLVSYGRGFVTLSEDINHFGKFMIDEIFEVNNRKEPYAFFITSERKCIPHDYYPCPSSIELANNSIPEYLAIIQSAEDNKNKEYYDKAIEYILKAIEIEPNNPYPYYWGSKYILENFNSLENNLFLEANSIDVKKWLMKAYELENRDIYRLKINMLIINYNKKYNPNILANSKIYKESKIIANSYVSEGLSIIGGFEFTNQGGIEVGANIARFHKSKNSTFLKNSNFAFIYFGGSYLYFPSSNLRGYKLNLLSIYAPVRFGITTILYNNPQNKTDHFKLAFRPELGYTYQNISVYYGYNLYKRNEFFDDFSKHIIGIRYQLPIFQSIVHLD